MLNNNDVLFAAEPVTFEGKPGWSRRFDDREIVSVAQRRNRPGLRLAMYADGHVEAQSLDDELGCWCPSTKAPTPLEVALFRARLRLTQR